MGEVERDTDNFNQESLMKAVWEVRSDESKKNLVVWDQWSAL